MKRATKIKLAPWTAVDGAMLFVDSSNEEKTGIVPLRTPRFHMITFTGQPTNTERMDCYAYEAIHGLTSIAGHLTDEHRLLFADDLRDALREENPNSHLFAAVMDWAATVALSLDKRASARVIEAKKQLKAEGNWD